MRTHDGMACHGRDVTQITVSNLIEDSCSFAGPSRLQNSLEASVRDTAPRGAGVPFKGNSSEDMVVDGDDPKDYL